MHCDEDILVVGLTGMSGAGKSTACGVFRRKGFAVIDCDIVSREVVEKGKPALREISKCFSDDVVKSDGILDRKKLGGIVFSDRGKLDKLNRIIYPYISYSIISKMCGYSENGEKLILLDAPTLFESGVDGLCDVIVSVTAPIDCCAERIMKRDNITAEQAHNRLSSQHNEAFYRERSDYCICNDGDIERLKADTADIADRIGDING